MDPILARYEEAGYSASFTPFRRVVAVECPPRASVRVESVEVRATCPDGWHATAVYYA